MLPVRYLCMHVRSSKQRMVSVHSISIVNQNLYKGNVATDGLKILQPCVHLLTYYELPEDGG